MIDASKFVMDYEAERVILGTYKEERTAAEISEIYGIPIAACYRKSNELTKAGLIAVSGHKVTSRGKKIKMYKAKLEDAYVFYQDGRMKVRFQVILSMAEDFRNRMKNSPKAVQPQSNV